MDTQNANFTDNQGREWRLVLDFTTAQKIKKVTGLDFVNYHDGKALMMIHDDDVKLVQVLWLLCEEQAQADKVDEESFGRGLGGDAMENAIAALEGALLNFSRPSRRTAIAAIRDKTRELVKAQTTLVTEKINGETFQAAIDQRLANVSTQIDKDLARAASATIGR